MTVTAATIRAFIVAAALAASAPSCRAERNRLLPFWGQPFPTGFTRGEIDNPGPRPDCIGMRRTGRGHARCVPVLHARD